MQLLERIPKIENLPYAVIAQIKQLIRNGDLVQGMKLPTERELSEQMGVGRSSIREALRILQFCGVVDVRHGIGTYLMRDPNDLGDILFAKALADSSTLLDLIEVRTMLEVLVAGVAAEAADPERLAELRAVLDSLDQSGDDLQKYFEADLRFHESLARCTKNSVMVALMKLLHQLTRDEAQSLLKTTHSSIVRGDVFGRIFQCIEQGDSAGAREAMREHMSGVSNALIRQHGPDTD